MAVKILGLTRFIAGWATDRKEGQANSFWYSRGIDFRKNRSKFSVLPTTRKDTGGSVSQLIQNIVQTTDGVFWGLGEGGGVYRRTTAGVWKKFGDLSTTAGAFGMVYRDDLDKLFLAQTDRVSEIAKVTTANPVLNASKYATSASTDTGALFTGGTTPYTVQTTQGNSEFQSFVSDIEPLYSISVEVLTKGTGNLVMTVHDAAHNLLDTITITNGNMVVGTNEFVLTTPLRMLVKPNGATYHVHITSTVADTTLASTDGTMTNINLSIKASRFIITRNGMHPGTTFNQYVVFGNGRYVSAWEPLSDVPGNTEWERHKIVLPPGYEVCGLIQWQEYLAIAAEKITTQADGAQFQDGKIFFWDGTSRTYNYYIDVPEGSPYSLSCHEQVLKYVAGGVLYGYAGGRPVKLRTFRGTDSEYSAATDLTINYPYMMAVRRNVHLVGFASKSTNATLERGVYSYGAYDDDQPNSFGFSYIISTGRYTGGSTFRIGCVRNFGDTLFISWQDGTDYGVDVVDNNSAPQASTRLELLRFDEQKPWKLKRAKSVIVTMETLPAGATVQPELTIDSGTPITGDTAVAGDTKVVLDIPQTGKNQRFSYVDVAVNVGASAITPYVTGIFFEFDDASEEEKVK